VVRIDRGHVLTYAVAGSDDETVLHKYGDYFFDNLILFAPTAEGSVSDARQWQRRQGVSRMFVHHTLDFRIHTVDHIPNLRTHCFVVSHLHATPFLPAAF
jgi:hypothetical protein